MKLFKIKLCLRSFFFLNKKCKPTKPNVISFTQHYAESNVVTHKTF